MRKLATVATIVGTGLLATGCGGGGGGTPALQGSVAGPAVTGAQVNMIEIDGTGAFVRTIGQMLTGQGGVFQSDLEIGGPMRLEIPNGFYVDPVTGQSVSIAVEGGLLRAFIPGRGVYSITALTTLAAEITQGSIDDGQPISKAIEDALTRIGDAFEVTDTGTIVRFDALRTSVADLTTSGTAPLALTPETLYATILAGLSQYAATLNTQASVATGTISLVDLLGELVKDAKDGSIDGVDASGSQPVNLTLSGVPIVPTGKTFGQALGEAVTQVEPSLAGLSSSMATTVATALGQSGDGGGTVLLGPTQPTIAAVSSAFAGTPNEAHWSGGDQITITGTNFQAGAQVYLGVPGGSSVAATDVLIVSSATLTAKLAADTNDVTADTGLRSVSVVNTNGTAATALQALQLVGPPASGLAVQLSTNSQSVNSVVAITGSSSTNLVDENGRDVLSGEVVTLSGAFVADTTAGGMAGPALSGSSTTTDGSSNIAFSLSTLSRSTGIYTITAKGATTGFTSTTAVTFTPGVSQTITLSPSSTTVTADGSAVSFMGTVVDQYGNGVVDNTAIALSSATASADQGSFPGGTSILTSAGTLSFSYTSPTSTGDGTAKVTATDTTTGATVSSTLTLIPGAPATVTFDGLSAASLSSDGTGGLLNATSGAFSNAGQITGNVTDGNGNRVGVLALTVTSSGPVLATGSFQTTATGSFTFDVQASSVIGGTGAAAQGATVFVTALGATSAHALLVYPGAGLSRPASLSMPTSIVAGTSTTITGVFEDQHGNPILDGQTVEVAHTNLGSTTSPAAIAGGAGAFSFSYTAATATGTDEITVTVRGADGSSATRTASLTIIPDAPSAFDAVTLLTSSTTLSIDGSNGPQSLSFRSTLRDQRGNPVAQGLSVLAAATTDLEPASQTYNTDSSGAVEVTVRANASSTLTTAAAGQPGSGTVKLTADGYLSVTIAVNATINPGAPASGGLAFDPPVPATFTASNTPLTVKGTVKDLAGNFVLDGTPVTVSSTEGTVTGTDADPGTAGFQVKTVSGTFAFDVLLTDSRNDPTFTATALDVPSATITSLQVDVLPPTPFALVPTTGLSTTTLSVDGTVGAPSLTVDYTLRDALGVPVPNKTITLSSGGNLAPLTATTSTSDPGGTFQFTVTAASLLSPANGGQTATGTITISEATSPTSTGALAITVFPGVPASFADIVKPSTPFTATSTDFTVTATLKDGSGNTVLNNTPVTVSSDVAVLFDGSTTSTLTVTTTAGALSFDLRLRDSAKDPTITLTSGAATTTIGPINVVPAVAASIEITDDAAFRAARLSVDGPDSQAFAVLVNDTLGNPVENATVNLVVGKSLVGSVSATSTQTNVAGLLSAVFTAATKATTTTVSASVAGGSGALTTTTVATVVEGALKTLAFTATTAQDSPLLVNEEAGGAQVEYKGTAVDQYGNPVGLQGTVSFTAEILGTTGVLAVGVGSSTAEIAGFSTSTYSGTVSTTDGTFVFYLRGVTKSGPLSVKVHDASGTISDTSPSETFLAGEAATITGFGFTGATSVVVGQTLSGLQGTVKDRFGNLVETGTVVDLSAPGANAGFTTSTFSQAAPTTASGIFSGDLTAGTDARTETITAIARGLTGTPVTDSTASTTVTILPGTPDATKSGFALRNATFPVNNPPHLTADGECQVTIVNTATITDAYGNVIPTSEVFDVTIEPSATTGRPTAPATATRLTGGNLSVLATAGTATGTFTLTVTSHASTTQSASISLTLEPKVFARAGTDSTSGLSPTLVGMADLDHDGNLDLVEAATGTLKTVFVSFGDGAGGFSATTTSGVLSGLLHAFTLADLEPDGDVDLVAATGAGIETLRFARTTRSFGTATTVTSTPTNDVQVADIDRDGIPDIVGLGSSKVVVLTGAGTSTITYPTAATVSVGTGANSRLAVGDITSSGWPDVVVIDGTSLYLLENDNAGSLATIAPTQIAAAGASSLALADIDRDGDLDLVLGLATTGGGGKIRVRRNTGSSGSMGASRFTTTFDLTAPAGIDMGPVHDVAVGNVDRNGKPDIVCAFADSKATTLSRVGVFFQDDAGNALFTRPMIPVFSFDLRPGSTVGLGDLDHDGVLDLAAAVTELCPPASSRTGASVALGLGDALSVTFADGAAVFTTPASPDVTDIASADVYLDGGDDVVIVRGPLTTPFSTITTVEVHDYLHGAEVTTTSTAIVGLSERVTVRVRVADMNRDGAPDLVFHTVTGTLGAAGGTSTKNRVEYPINLGGGLFEVAPGVVTTTTPPGTVADAALLAVGPFARGGGPDAIVKLTASKEVRVAVSSGTSTPSVVVTSTPGFAAAVLGGNPGRAVPGDFNADGAVDLAVGVRDAFGVYTRLSVLYGDPADTDGDGDLFLAVATSSAIVVDNVQTIFTGYDAGVAGDFDNDGVDDIALLSSARVAIFSPKPTSTAAQARWDALEEITTLGFDPTAIAAADFNRDGNLDLVVAQTVGADAEIRVFLRDGAGGVTEKRGTLTTTDALLTVPVTTGGPFGPVQRIITPDLNQDGRPDIVVAQNGQVTVFLSTGVQGSSGTSASTGQATKQAANQETVSSVPTKQ